MPTALNWPFVNQYIGPPGRRFRSLQVIEQPVVEPVTLAEVKLHLRIDHEEEDTLLMGLIAAARHYVERRIDRHLIDTRLQMSLDMFPADVEIRLPRPPFSPTPGRQTIELEYIDGSLVTHSMTEDTPNLQTSGTKFLANRHSVPAILTPNINGYWPVVGPVRSAVTIRWWAGYGDSPQSVPKGLSAACLMLIGHWYVQRETVAVNIGNAPSMPYGVDELLSMHAWGSYA